MAWSLFDEKAVELKPKVFSNGKTQEDIVNEAVSEIKKGTKIIFIHGTCGTGKSAIALNIAKELGKASIIVPIKNLQRQYESDYMAKKYLLKNNGEKLKIDVITGRKNHACPYLFDNKEQILETRKEEKNSSLFDIFIPEQNKEIKFEDSCDNPYIPCKIEIKLKNLKTIKKYYNENPDRKNIKDIELKKLRRLAVAPACAYWSPILNINKKINLKAELKKYKSIAGEHALYLRKEGCPYYKQFLSYADSDAVIFNSEQYMLETALGRKPATEVEIIDECDEFLDSFAVEETINLDRLKKELKFMEPSEPENILIKGFLAETLEEAMHFAAKHKEDEIIKIKNTPIEELIKTIAKNDVLELAEDDESYIEHCFEISEKFYDSIDESYACFYRDRKKDLYLKLVTINLDKEFDFLLKKNKAFVLMSGTIHSEKILKEIFGMKDFKIINAETFNLGTITKIKTNLEKDFKFDNFDKGRVSREDYLRALDRCIEKSEKPSVVHVISFSDLPSESEKERFGLKNLISYEQIIEEQKNDKEGKIVKDFKAGKTKILFTTRCSRGMDFPFGICNSTIITKFPYPSMQSLFWRILKRDKPEIFWEFYKDKAHRELLQRIYRSVRAADDHVFLFSPDIRVLNSRIV